MDRLNRTRIQRCLTAWLFACIFLTISCEKEEIDNRAFEGVSIVGVKVNNDLMLPSYMGDEAMVMLPAGRDLSKLNLQLLVANGELINFQNNTEYDCRKPLTIHLKGSDGSSREVALKIQSPPLLATFIVEGLAVPEENIHFNLGSLIVQAPPGTDLTSLAVTMEFLNGTLQDFTNGQAADYTEPTSFTLLGVDEETRYVFDFIITTEEVGPASVKAMTINGVPTDSVVVVAPATLIPYVNGLTDFSNAEVTLETGFGNQVDAAFSGEGLDLLAGTNKIKITGSDGIETEFTIARPQLSLTPLVDKPYDQFGFGANDMAGVAFSGDYIVIANYSAVSPTVIGPNYYDLAGNQVGVLDKSDVVIAHSLRKPASDDDGKMLVASLGITSDQQTIYKWDDVTATPVPYITYSQAVLGIDVNPRTAGINITGRLDGDAIITVGLAQRAEVYVWKVQGGVLNPTPSKLAIPYDRTSFYWSVEPLPIGVDGFVAAVVGNNFSGLASLTNTLSENHAHSGIMASDCKVKTYNGRIYLAYTAYVSGRGAVMRICDITDGESDSYKNPIFENWMDSNQPNANNTMDVDMAVINGKLHAVFACTNIGMQLYKLEN